MFLTSLTSSAVNVGGPTVARVRSPVGSRPSNGAASGGCHRACLRRNRSVFLLLFLLVPILDCFYQVIISGSDELDCNIPV
jgi:hypothetical protein